jgi:hypothetical protein
MSQKNKPTISFSLKLPYQQSIPSNLEAVSPQVDNLREESMSNVTAGKSTINKGAPPMNIKKQGTLYLHSGMVQDN